MLAVFARLVRMWRDLPLWAFPLCVAVFGLKAFNPGSLWLHFGPEPDYARPLAVRGEILIHVTIRGPYSFKTDDGRTLHLACFPQMQVSSCLEDRGFYTRPLQGKPLGITYLPLLGSTSYADGIIIGLKTEDSGQIWPYQRLSDLRRYERPHKLNLIVVVLKLIMAAVAFALLTVLGTGLVGFVTRLLRGKAPPGTPGSIAPSAARGSAARA